jgi:hypothetical protein
MPAARPFSTMLPSGAYICSFVLRFASCSTPATCPWMQLHASLCLLLHACCPPIDAASCSVPATTPMDITLCFVPTVVPSSLPTRTWGLLCPTGLPSPAPPCHACSWNTCNIKAFAATYVQNRWNIYNICWQHMCMALHYMQHPIKTLATYVWNSWNTLATYVYS